LAGNDCRNQGGKIVHIASAATSCRVPPPRGFQMGGYRNHTLAMELAPYKINVNAINPGFATNLRDEMRLCTARERNHNREFRAEEHKCFNWCL
jgi:NAD(P)-dependent dehydrogenase (short-subunit alcohol dehydrogenase family)